MHHNRFRCLFLPLLAAVVLDGCGGVPALLDELSPERSCRRTVWAQSGPGTEVIDGYTDEPESAAPADAAPEARALTVSVTSQPAEVDADEAEVDWVLPPETLERQKLNAWCAAVGPAVLAVAEARLPEAVDSFAIVSWNVHVGGGQLRRLVDDLRVGRLTGGAPVKHFAILLQEAHHESDLVPDFEEEWPGGGLIEAVPAGGERIDVEEAADALGLHLFYAPSMRNGAQNTDGGREDRGNAILATLPLHDPRAIELPAVRQRRVAVAAEVRGRSSDGDDWSVQLASVHLENDAEGWLNAERARLIQGKALLSGLEEADAAVAGGDFNTWTRGTREAVINEMRSEYPDTPAFPPGPTYARAYGVVRMYLDYLFARLPDDGRLRYARVPDLYGSDHYPLVGWVVP